MGIHIPEEDYEWTAIRSGGSGGQHVNKVSTAVQLRYDIKASSLPDALKGKLLTLRDKRINKEGILIIRSHQHRSQQRNKDEALRRLSSIIERASKPNKRRIPTKPTKASKERRFKSKLKRSETKANRKKIFI